MSFPVTFLLALATWLLLFALPQRSRAEDRADYSYSDYAENNGRIHVETQGVYFGLDVKPWLSRHADIFRELLAS